MRKGRLVEEKLWKGLEHLNLLETALERDVTSLTFGDPLEHLAHRIRAWRRDVHLFGHLWTPLDHLVRRIRAWGRDIHFLGCQESDLKVLIYHGSDQESYEMISDFCLHLDSSLMVKE